MEPDADEVLEFEAEEEGARRLFNEHRHVKRAWAILNASV